LATLLPMIDLMFNCYRQALSTFDGRPEGAYWPECSCVINMSLATMARTGGI
jgi:hypothetical protein